VTGTGAEATGPPVSLKNSGSRSTRSSAAISSLIEPLMKSCQAARKASRVGRPARSSIFAGGE
jgi:hypothetical protein